MTKNRDQIYNLTNLGLEAASFLTSNFDDPLIYEKVAELIFSKMDELIDQLRFYVIDEEMKNLKEEVIYNDTGWRPGYDLIQLYQLPSGINENRVLRFRDKDYNYLKVPLETGSKLLGLIEFRTIEFLSDEIVKDIKTATSIISLGLSSVLFESDTLREKENTEFSILINNRLQSIKELDLLINEFLKMTINHFKFDRITVFIFNQEGEISSARGINERGRNFNISNYPEIPDLSSDYISIDDTLGYWFPLRTNTGIVGVVLFDNIYTLYKVSDTFLNTIRIICSQFANTIDNIRMFSSLQKTAYIDVLTGLHNRTYLEETLPYFEGEENLPLSIIIGDLNGLKVTNDVFGHNIGDELLKKMAEVLKLSCSEDDFVFRWGGDEFIIISPGRGEDETDCLCQRINENCSKVKDTRVQLSISLGCACKVSRDEKIKDIMKEAEDRMYRHKLLETKEFRSSLLSSLRETLVKKCHESVGHAERMTRMAVMIGEKIGLAGTEMDDLKLLAMLHDIGKVAISDKILNKTGSLNDKEWEEMKKHSEAGYRIAHASFELSQIANYILNHHERWDGKGYPLGRKKFEIPLLSRIISVVDAYDVMTHKRPYKTTISHKEALEELNNCAGQQFDPEIVQVFTNLDFNMINMNLKKIPSKEGS